MIQETHTEKGITYGKDEKGNIYEYVEYHYYMNSCGEVDIYGEWEMIETETN